jgi:hypothetical protein
MTSVSASASGYGTVSLGTRSGSRLHPAAELAIGVLVAGALALAAPLDVVVFGLLVVGLTHVLFELRYVIGRYPAVARGGTAIIVQATLGIVVACRLLASSPFSRTIEISTWGALLGAAVVFVARRSPRLVIAGLAVVAVATAIALAHPRDWLVVQAHLHNLVPVAFLWDWSARHLDRPSRIRLRAVTVGWAVVVPALFLSGALDPLLATGSGWAVRVFGLDSAFATVTPPAWREGIMPLRLLGAFAFAQVVHYVVWIWFLPRHAPETTAAFAATPPGRWLRGGRFFAVVIGLTAVVIAVAASDYGDGRTLYGAFGAYHAYLEYPVLVALAASAVIPSERA